MRLVEILARELVEWPEGADSAWQSEFDSEIYFDGCEWNCSFFAKEAADDRGYPNNGVGVTREMWEAERAKVEGKTEWNGEGLPPVGVECEIRYLGKYNNNWMPFRATAITNDFIVGYIRNDRESAVKHKDPYVEFRPIRAQEQIAAQERDRALDDIYRIMRTVERPGNKADMAEALYAAGYRKQEQSE